MSDYETETFEMPKVAAGKVRFVTMQADESGIRMHFAFELTAEEWATWPAEAILKRMFEPKVYALCAVRDGWKPNA